MVLVTRADLKLSSGKLAAQAGHASVACALTARKIAPRILEQWMSNGARKVVCQASNLDALKRLYGEAREFELVAEMITDAGHTEIPPGTITMLGIGPGPRRSIDALTGTLPLLK